MPLHAGKSSKVVSQNIKEMMAAGHDQKQSVAAAMRMKDESTRKKMHDHMNKLIRGQAR